MFSISALPISAVSSLITVSVNLAASGALLFSATPVIGNISPIAASGTLSFTGTPTAYKNVAITASTTIRFASDADLRVAGKPFEVFALPQNYTMRATLADYTVKAVPASYTVRAKR